MAELIMIEMPVCEHLVPIKYWCGKCVAKSMKLNFEENNMSSDNWIGAGGCATKKSEDRCDCLCHRRMVYPCNSCQCKNEFINKKDIKTSLEERIDEISQKVLEIQIILEKKNIIDSFFKFHDLLDRVEKLESLGEYNRSYGLDLHESIIELLELTKKHEEFLIKLPAIALVDPDKVSSNFKTLKERLEKLEEKFDKVVRGTISHTKMTESR